MPPPVTPEKRGKRAQSKASNGEETPSKKAKTTPGSKSTPVKSNPIPATFEEAGPEDRMILHMRDNEGRSWADITTAWASMTGCSPAKNSLRVRYGRMKNNFVTFDSDHVGPCAGVFLSEIHCDELLTNVT